MPSKDRKNNGGIGGAKQVENNRSKGYTLVEILVAFAVLGIAVLAIGGFFVSAARSYSSVSDETTLQYEAQLALNQMEAMIVDSALGVSYNCIDNSGNDFMTSDIGGGVKAKGGSLVVG